MAVVIASSLRKEFSGSVLFEGVSFKVERRDRLALAGPNGAGKTTLLRALAGEVSLEGGELALSKGTRIALHDQRPPAESPRPLREYVLAGTADLAAVEQELRALEHSMASGTHDPATMRRYSEAQARLEHAGGYDWRDRAASFVRGLGFTDADLDRPLSTFSGGELTRASLARALASQPDLLLLDEPTNHLDIPAREALEAFLRETPATLLVVSHDRRLLEIVCDRMWVVDDGRIVPFDAGYRSWRTAVADGWRAGEAYLREEERFHGRGNGAGIAGIAGIAARPRPVGWGASTATAVRDTAAPPPASGPAQPPLVRAPRQPKLSKDAYRRQKAVIEDDLGRLGLRKSHLELALMNPTTAANFVELRRVTSELADVDQALAAAEEAWLLLEERAP